MNNPTQPLKKFGGSYIYNMKYFRYLPYYFQYTPLKFNDWLSRLMWWTIAWGTIAWFDCSLSIALMLMGGIFSVSLFRYIILWNLFLETLFTKGFDFAEREIEKAVRMSEQIQEMAFTKIEYDISKDCLFYPNRLKATSETGYVEYDIESIYLIEYSDKQLRIISPGELGYPMVKRRLFRKIPKIS